MSENKDRILQIKEELGVDETLAGLFLRYYELLVCENEKTNLTAITQFDEVLTKHFKDAKALLNHVNIDKGMKVADLGSGAGLPSIALAICASEGEFHSVESVGKKTRFQEMVIKELDLHNIFVENYRIEDFARKKEFRESFDLVCARALAPLRVLIEYALPLLKVGGVFAAYKSGTPEEEILEAENALKILGGELVSVKKFEIDENSRSLVFIEKKKHTDEKYPRKAGIPTKKPL